MMLEVIEVPENEQRVILLFDEKGSAEQQQVDSYLNAQGLEPKRQYTEVRDDKEYLVYYFGHCYLGDHIEQLSSIATNI